MTDKEYEVRDTIWGFISYNAWERDIIDMPEFQRLRRIKQLALTEMVYPGAHNTRFEHSLGVMHLASKMYDNICKKDKLGYNFLEKEIGYTSSGLERTRQIIRLAALLHDIGHAPFSHASEEIMPVVDNRTNEKYSHEYYTAAIIMGPLRKTIEEHTLNKNYNITAEEIAGLIMGNKELLGKANEYNLMWKNLLSGQLDADRGDYLLRDSYYTGVKYGVYDVERLIVTSILGRNPEVTQQDGGYNSWIIGVGKGGWQVAEALIIARYSMFSQVVFHKTRMAYDYHFNEVMRSFLKEKFGKSTFPLPTEEGLNKFLSLDDTSVWNYMNENRKKDENCRAIIERKHIRRIYETPENPSDKDIDKINENMEILKRAGLFCYRAKLHKRWYELGGSDSPEIIVFKTHNQDGEHLYGEHLSTYSKIVTSLMEGIRQQRIYVKSDDLKEAEGLLKNKK